MNAHTCKTLTRGCYRCDLNVDEMHAEAARMRDEIHAVGVTIRHLEDHRRDLTLDLTAILKALAKWEQS